MPSRLFASPSNLFARQIRLRSGTFWFAIFAYAALGVASLRLASLNHSTSPFWPPSGFAVGLLAMEGPWLATAVFLGAWITNLSTGAPLLAVTAIALGNTLEAIAGAALLHRMKRLAGPTRSQMALAFLVSGLGSASIGAAIGSTSLLVSGVISREALAYNWITWMTGDLVGICILAPLVFSIYQCKPDEIWDRPGQSLKALLLICSFVVFHFFLLSHQWPDGFLAFSAIALIHLNLLRHTFWSRFGLLVLGIELLLLSLGGRPPFEMGNSNLNLLYIQGLLICCATLLAASDTYLDRDLSRANRWFFLAALVLASTIVISFSLTTQKSLERKFEERVADVHQSLAFAEEKYSLLLRGGAGMLLTYPGATMKDWRKFVEVQAIAKNYPAINGYGFVSNIPAAEVAAFERRIQKEGHANYKVKQLDAAFSRNFSNTFPITYVEPISKNGPALGLDLGSEAIRREAAERSIRRRAVTASNPIQLVQDAQKRPGFLILFPLFRESESTKPDISNLRGFAYAPLVAEKFYSTALGSVSDGFVINIRQDQNTLWSSDPNSPLPRDGRRFFSQTPMTVFGNDLQVNIFSKPEFFWSRGIISLALTSILVLLLVLITDFFAGLALFNKKLQALVQSRSQELDKERAKALHSAKLASLGEMAAGIGHEINNPLAIIDLQLEVLQQDNFDEEQRAKRLEKIRKAVDRITHIVGSLRRYSRASTNSPHIEENIAKAIDEAILITSASANVEQVKIERCGEFGNVNCNHIELEQIFVNLINNSIHATKTLKDRWIRIEGRISGNISVVKLIDSGPGITEAVEEKLFQPFFTTKPVGQGTGLGLSIVRNLLDAHGASIRVDHSQKNTCFELTFPLAGTRSEPSKVA